MGSQAGSSKSYSSNVHFIYYLAVGALEQHMDWLHKCLEERNLAMLYIATETFLVLCGRIPALRSC